METNGYEWSRWEVMDNCKPAEEHFQGQASESVDLHLARTWKTVGYL